MCTSFISNAATALLVHHYLAGQSGTTMAVRMILAGLCVGVIHGWFFPRRYARHIAIAAFFALCLLWTPVVLASYGFGLIALPILLIYALAVFFGARFGAENPLWKKSDA